MTQPNATEPHESLFLPPSEVENEPEAPARRPETPAAPAGPVEPVVESSLAPAAPETLEQLGLSGDIVLSPGPQGALPR